jgi:exopolysaccharide biosynthesis polyprenyl glycosylphosphotransferase
VSIIPSAGSSLAERTALDPIYAPSGHSDTRAEPRSTAEGPSTRRAVPRVLPYNRHLFVELCRPADAAVALLVFGTIFVVANADAMPNGLNEFLLLRLSLGNLLTLGLFGFLWQLLFLSFGLYETVEPRTLRTEAPSVVAACTLGALVTLLPVHWSRSGAYSLRVVLIAWPLTVAVTLYVRFCLRVIAERAQTSRVKRVVIVGSGPLAVRLYNRMLDDPTLSYEVLGFVDTNVDIRPPEVRERLLGSLDQLDSLLMQTVVDEVVIALPIKSHYAEIQRAIEECERAGVESRYSPDLFHGRLARPRFETPDGQPAIAMKVVSDDYRLVVKRAIDIVGAAIGLVLLSPLFATIAIAVRVTSRGPVFFSQERYGWRKRRFKMHKFRTMISDAESLQSGLEARNEAVGPVFKIKNDPRMTSIGAFLRKSSLDELPQLWNVLRGEMSLVGPRPLPIRDVHKFEDSWLMRRFSVVPGMTGLWQVSGRSELTFQDWVQLDLRYIDQWSLRLDLSLLLRTFPAVLQARGAR